MKRGSCCETPLSDLKVVPPNFCYNFRISLCRLSEWVTSLFRQVFRLYENLPEEGGKVSCDPGNITYVWSGKGNKVGGKTEEAMLSSVKSALDMVCQHLSDDLFDIVLRQTYEYASTTARANSIRAFGQLIASLSRVQPEKTLDLFFPLCAKKIEEELVHGASSVRTTSSHTVSPRDTVFNWCKVVSFLR
jgi:proteasome activator subunit 4